MSMYIRFYLYGYNLKEQLYEGVVDPLIKLEAILLHGTDNSKSKLLGQAEAALVSSTDASCSISNGRSNRRVR